MKNRRFTLPLVPAIPLFSLTFITILLFSAHPASAASGTWLAAPADNNWFNPANWSSGTVPVAGDDATFESSTIHNIVIPQGDSIADIIFDADADVFTITAQPGVGLGITDTVLNLSSAEQNFVAESEGNSSGSFTFEIGNIVGPVMFTQQATSEAAGAPGYVRFEIAQAGPATFHSLGATSSGGVGGQTYFIYTGTSADACTVTNDGASASGASGGGTLFLQGKPSAGNATLIANGGTNGGGGGYFLFDDGSLGGTARLEVFGNGYMDMTGRTGPSLSIGSIEGDGQIYLSKGTLMVGTNNLSTTFSGVLHPGSSTGGSGTGALTKIGSGTLTLSGANLYTAGTTVSAGTLVVSNTTGSATGTGAVQVSAGTLGGGGVVSGAVTIGTGGGTGAFLAPAHGTQKQATLTIQSGLTLQADATYTYTFKAKRNKARTDKGVANGVTINGATFVFQGTAQGALKQGLVLTVISNTSASPITGTFANLPDGAIVTVNGNNFQASYEGGDGNDLTLTVVP
jgi:autotransporter-associated beta strand protein